MLNTLQLGRIGKRSASSYSLDETSVIKGGFAHVYAAAQGSKRLAVKVYSTDCLDKSSVDESEAISVSGDESDERVGWRRNRSLRSRGRGHRNSSIISRAWRMSWISKGSNSKENVRVSTGTGRKQVQVVQVIEELRILARLQRSPYVVRLHDAFQLEDDFSKVWIVMEYLYGSLDEIMGRFTHLVEDEGLGLAEQDEEEKLTPMDVEDVAVVTKEVLLALEFIHSKGVAHLDIKPANILFSDRGHVKLCDFGSALIVEEARDHTEIPQSTAAYMAPEIIARGEIFGRSADIFSLGVIVYEMTAATLPWKPTDFAAAFGEAERRAFEEGDDEYTQQILLNMAPRIVELEVRQENIGFVTEFLTKTIVPLYSENDLEDITRDSQLRRASVQQLKATDLIQMAPPNGKQSHSAILGVISKYQHLQFETSSNIPIPEML